MYKLMIADDEPLAREVLKTVIEENFDNIGIAGEANSGKQAVELSSQLQPDIILMDIRMPGMNGIEASRQILAERPGTVILVITAYDDFNYIQQALELGVRGYLLKPIKDQDVVEKINKSLKHIDSLKNLGEDSQKIEEKVNIIKPLIQRGIVASLISGNCDAAELETYAGFLGERIEAGYFMLIRYKGDDSNQINAAIRNKIHKEKVYDITSKFIPLTRKCLIGEGVGNVQAVFFPAEQEYSEADIAREARLIAANIKNKLRVIAGLEVAIGIGGIYSGTENLKNSYNEANIALKRAASAEEILHYGDLAGVNSTRTFQYPVQLENELLEHIRTSDWKRARELAGDILKYLYDSLDNLDVIKGYLNQLVSVLNRTALQMGYHSMFAGNLDKITDLNRADRWEEVELWYQNYVHSMLEDLAGSRQQSRDRQIVGLMKEYLDRHYCKDITLEGLAEEIGLGPSYISRLFKEELGVNFIDFITEKRIALAKEMLASGEKNIKKISEAAGYHDINYFCRVFKKITGMTTGQYRLQSLKLEQAGKQVKDK